MCKNKNSSLFIEYKKMNFLKNYEQKKAVTMDSL